MGEFANPAASSAVRIARTRDDFLRLVEEALGEDDPEARFKRQAAVSAGTWEARASWVGDLIERVLDAKNQSKKSQ